MTDDALLLQNFDRSQMSFAVVTQMYILQRNLLM